jgi:hypothetical protein
MKPKRKRNCKPLINEIEVCLNVLAKLHKELTGYDLEWSEHFGPLEAQDVILSRIKSLRLAGGVLDDLQKILRRVAPNQANKASLSQVLRYGAEKLEDEWHRINTRIIMAENKIKKKNAD